MKAFLILLLLSAGPVLSQTGKEVRSPEPYIVEPPAPPEKEPAGEQVYSFVEEEAEFPGGREALLAFLDKNVRMPEFMQEKNIRGKCFLKFIVHADGAISDIRIVRKVPNCPECDNEALRAVKMMPKWKPARNNGKNVKSYFTLPINFAVSTTEKP